MANVLELYDRFKGGGRGGKMVYPLENQADYLGKMTFTPIIEDRVDIAERAGNFVELGKDLIAQSFDAVLGDGGGQPLPEGRKSAIAQAEEDRLGIDPGRSRSSGFAGRSRELLKRYGIDKNGSGGKLSQAVVEGYNSSTALTTSTPFAKEGTEPDLELNTGKRISLYLPRAIQIQDTVSYDNNFQLGMIGGAIENAMMSGGSMVGAAVGAAAATASGVGKTLMGNTSGMGRDAAGIIAGRVGTRVPGIGDAAGGAIRSATRLTTNPNTRALFKDVPIRNFSFAFQLVPTSRVEARMIEQIIKTFREELYPEALTAANVNIGYRFPNRFLIKVRYNNAAIKGIRFLPVYMQSFNATYNSATGGMHNDGRFTSVDISMAFTETRAIAKADIRDGGY